MDKAQLRKLIGEARLDMKKFGHHKRGCHHRIYSIIEVVAGFEWSKCQGCERLFRNKVRDGRS